MGKYTIFYLFENPSRGMQARNFTTNAPKILDLKSSSEQIFFRKLSLGAPVKRRFSRDGALIFLFALYLMFLFTGNGTNIPAVLQPSSSYQRFRLLTICCQRFWNIISQCSQWYFYVVRPTHNSWFPLAIGAVSLFSSRAAALFSRFSLARVLPSPNRGTLRQFSGKYLFGRRFEN